VPRRPPRPGPGRIPGRPYAPDAHRFVARAGKRTVTGEVELHATRFQDDVLVVWRAEDVASALRGQTRP
jgi:hypothetical protein